MREGRRIQSRGLSTAKYEGLEMANKEKTIREVDGVTLYNSLDDIK